MSSIVLENKSAALSHIKEESELVNDHDGETEIRVPITQDVSPQVKSETHSKELSSASLKEKCKERFDNYKKEIKREMPLSDQLDMRDPQCIAEFAQSIYLSMFESEKNYALDNEYLKKVQTEIKDTSRGFLVEWIIDVHRKFRLLPETLHVTVSIIDRYLSKVNIKKSQLHMLGVASLLIATKYEEIYPPDLKELLNISENKFTKEEVLQMEF